MNLDLDEVLVVYTDDFDGAIRKLTGWATYESDRGTGTVAGKTVLVGEVPAVVLNSQAIGNADPPLLERLAAHESGHVLLQQRNEHFEGLAYASNSDWERTLTAMAAYKIEEYRIEKSLRARGYPAAGSSESDHIAFVLHWTTVDLLNLLIDPASDDVMHLYRGVMGLADRLTTVLAYTAAFDLEGDQAARLESEGTAAVEGWREYVEPSWSQRVHLYQQVPSVDDPLAGSDLLAHVMAGAEVERALVESMGFVFSNGSSSWNFDRQISDEALYARHTRAVAQEELYETQQPSPED